MGALGFASVYGIFVLIPPHAKRADTKLALRVCFPDNGTQHPDDRIHIASAPVFFAHTVSELFVTGIIGEFFTGNPVWVKIIVEMNRVYRVATYHIFYHIGDILLHFFVSRVKVPAVSIG